MAIAHKKYGVYHWETFFVHEEDDLLQAAAWAIKGYPSIKGSGADQIHIIDANGDIVIRMYLG